MRVEILAPTTADISCNGWTLIGSKGSITGSVLTRSIKIETGGEHHGTMSILQGELDEKKEVEELQKLDAFQREKQVAGQGSVCAFGGKRDRGAGRGRCEGHHRRASGSSAKAAESESGKEAAEEIARATESGGRGTESGKIESGGAGGRGGRSGAT